MKLTPLQSAIVAELYIIGVATFMFNAPKFLEGEDTFMAPIAMLSLLVLSVALMGYLFCLQPLSLFLEGKKEDAVSAFLKTVMYFAGITLLAFCLLILIQP